MDVAAGRERRVSKMKLPEGRKSEKRKMDNQLNCSCCLLVSKAEPLWLPPCAMTFESARFLSKINDLPVFSYRISLHRVFTAVQFDLKCTLKNAAEFIVRGKTAKVCGREECTHEMIGV